MSGYLEGAVRRVGTENRLEGEALDAFVKCAMERDEVKGIEESELQGFVETEKDAYDLINPAIKGALTAACMSQTSGAGSIARTLLQDAPTAPVTNSGQPQPKQTGGPEKTPGDEETGSKVKLRLETSFLFSLTGRSFMEKFNPDETPKVYDMGFGGVIGLKYRLHPYFELLAGLEVLIGWGVNPDRGSPAIKQDYFTFGLGPNLGFIYHMVKNKFGIGVVGRFLGTLHHGKVTTGPTFLGSHKHDLSKRMFVDAWFATLGLRLLLFENMFVESGLMHRHYVKDINDSGLTQEVTGNSNGGYVKFGIAF